MISKIPSFPNYYFRPYACTLCSAKYYRKYQLVKHLDSKHAQKSEEVAENVELLTPVKTTKDSLLNLVEESYFQDK